MESRNRGVWILVVLAAVALCCCVVLLAGAAAARVWDWGWSWGLDVPGVWRESGSGAEGTRIERAYEVDGAPTLSVDNFAGSVTIQSGDENEIRVVAVKHAPRRSDLDRIEVDISPQGGGVRVKTNKPATLSNAWVELTIRAPASAYLDLKTGSGSVDVRGLQSGAQIDTGSGSIAVQNLSGDLSLHSGTGSVNAQGLAGQLKVDTGSGQISIQGMDGEVEAHTGSGGIDVRGADGWVSLSTGSGGVDYQGSPEGDCRFTTGSGSVRLRLPASLNAQVDVHTGSGNVQVDYPVEGRSTRTDVQGVIGSGGQTTLYVRTGSGSIGLSPD